MTVEILNIDLTLGEDKPAIDEKGDKWTIKVDKLDGVSDEDAAQDVTITGTSDVEEIKIKDWDGGSDADVFRFDLSTFSRDFDLKFDKQNETDEFFDTVVLSGADESSLRLDDDDVLVDFVGADGGTYTMAFDMKIAGHDDDDVALDLHELLEDILQFTPQIPVDAVNGTEGDDQMASKTQVYVDADGDHIDDITSDDYVFGYGGSDKIFTNGGADTIDGGSGNDFMRAGSGDDVIIGGSGNDVLDGGTGADEMTGGEGNDIYFVDNAGDTVSEEGGSGTDKVKSSVDFALGDGLENLWLTGSAVSATGNDLNNMLVGNGADNMITGAGGNDTILAGTGDDVASGGEGNDRIQGQGGADSIDGGAGNDKLWGDNGDDTLSGGEGNDRLIAGKGNDVLNSGIGDDILRGGNGDDVFVFVSGDGKDKIVDFDAGDVLQFTGLTYDDLSIETKWSSARISYGEDLVILKGVDGADLTMDDFLFV